MGLGLHRSHRRDSGRRFWGSELTLMNPAIRELLLQFTQAAERQNPDPKPHHHPTNSWS